MRLDSARWSIVLHICFVGHALAFNCSFVYFRHILCLSRHISLRNCVFVLNSCSYPYGYSLVLQKVQSASNKKNRKTKRAIVRVRVWVSIESSILSVDVALLQITKTYTHTHTHTHTNSTDPLNADLNPICHLLALLGGATIVVVRRLRVKQMLLIFTFSEPCIVIHQREKDQQDAHLFSLTNSN